MRYAYIRPFVDAAQSVLEHLLASRIMAGDIALTASPTASRGVTAIVGVTGEGEGRVLFDMTPSVALELASALNGRSFQELDALAKDTLSELASMMTGRAISALNDQGHVFKISPPTLFAGEGFTISSAELETLVVPLEGTFGALIVNVALTTC